MALRVKILILAGLVLAALGINLAGFVTGQDWGDDFAGYILQAQTLRSGDFAKLQHYQLHNPFVLNYPWGFPILLAPVIGQFYSNYTFLKVYVFVFFLIGLFFFYGLFRRDREQSLLALLLMAASPYFWYFKNNLGSDLPNLCFVLCALYLTDRFVVQRKKLLNAYADQLLLGIAIFAAFSMRTQSLVLLVTLGIMQLLVFGRELLQPRQLVIALLPYGMFFLLKFLVELLIPIKAVAYLNAYNGFSITETVWTNLFYYTNIWKELFSGVAVLQHIDGIVAGICLFLFFIGIGRYWKDNLLFIVFILLTGAMLLLTPFYQGIRYLMPVIPFFFYFFVKGSFYLATALYTRSSGFACYLLPGGIALLSLFSSFKLSFPKTPAPMVEGPYTRHAQSLFDFLQKNTSDTSLIGYWKPRAMLLYSGRNGVMPRSYRDCLEKKAGYYVYYRYAYADQMPLDSLMPPAGNYKKIYENDDFKVFKVLSGSAAANEAERIPGAGALCVTIDHQFFDPSLWFGPEKLIPLWSNAVISSKPFVLPEGKYLMCVYSKGTPALGEAPKSKLLLNDNSIGVFTSEPQEQRADLPFEIKGPTRVTLKLKLENDYSDKGEDRNTLISVIRIYKAI